MIHLTDGILLYHGSYADVRNVDFCFRNEDAVGALVYKESIRYGDI